MGGFTFDARVRLLIELALSAAHRTPSRDACQEAAARALGLSGAEIDVARRGRSFDVVTDAAIALATAAEPDRPARRGKAARAGISPAISDEIEAFAARQGALGERSMAHV